MPTTVTTGTPPTSSAWDPERDEVRALVRRFVQADAAGQVMSALLSAMQGPRATSYEGWLARCRTDKRLKHYYHLGEKVRSGAQAERLILHDWIRAETFCEDSPARKPEATILTEIDAIADAAEGLCWPTGTASRTNLVLYAALLSRAKLLVTAIPMVSVRELQIVTRIPSTATVHRALTRLAGLGLIDIKVNPAADHHGVRRYALLDPSLSELPLRKLVASPLAPDLTDLGNYSPEKIDGGVRNHVLVLPSVERHPLGAVMTRSRAFVYVALTAHPTSATDLASHALCCRRTADASLRELTRYGLAEKLDGGWVRGSADPDEVARMLGCEAKQEALVERIQRQRDGWRRVADRILGPARIVYRNESRRHFAVLDVPDPIPDGMVLETYGLLRPIRVLKSVDGTWAREDTGEVVAEPIGLAHPAHPSNRWRLVS